MYVILHRRCNAYENDVLQGVKISHNGRGCAHIARHIWDLGCVAGDAGLQHIVESIPAESQPGHEQDDRPDKGGVSLEAVVSPGRLCYCQVSLRSGNATSNSSAAAQGVDLALRKAHLSVQSIEGVRVYFSVSKATQAEAVELVQQIKGQLKVGWAPVLVPVASVGLTPAVDAALLIVLLALDIGPSEEGSGAC